MKKSIFITGLILVFAFSLSGCFNKEKENGEQGAKQEQTQAEQNQEETNEEEESFFGSMKDLLGGGISRKCTYEEVGENGGKTVGTLYVADNKAKSEVEFFQDGEKGVAHALIDSDWMYSWASFMPMATKMNITKLDDGEETNAQETAGAIEKAMNYKCRPWVKNNAKFKLPAGVEFKDVTEDMKELTESFKDIDTGEMETNLKAVTNQLCEMCENAPDEATKAECKASAGCE